MSRKKGGRRGRRKKDGGGSETKTGKGAVGKGWKGGRKRNGWSAKRTPPHQHQPHSTLIPAIIEIRGRGRHVPRGDRLLLLSHHTVSQPTGTRECSARENRDAAHTGGMRLCPRYPRPPRRYLLPGRDPFLFFLLLSAYQFLSMRYPFILQPVDHRKLPFHNFSSAKFCGRKCNCGRVRDNSVGKRAIGNR